MNTHFAGLAIVLLAVASSCTAMCQTPYDYCNAVIEPNGCPNCNFGARYGSVFAPMFGTPATTPLEPTRAAEPSGTDESAPSPSERPELYDDFESTGAAAISTDVGSFASDEADSSDGTADETTNAIQSFLASRSSQRQATNPRPRGAVR